ncbi:hypothetical protein B0H16DRAFT_1717729 [Mycena metata]|uniref:Uncharacterized protein n=1 Tax=Mycena metata TaxID=1033252 RepID=A0AAD7NL93_9AGAR|nr:hypothetical protein B0H16DRAFT_1717729 [Mycena metata]
MDDTDQQLHHICGAPSKGHAGDDGLMGVGSRRLRVRKTERYWDLQKGERYTNMDFILFSALLGFSLMWLTLSLSVKPGVGKSDGEGVECTWSVLNPTAYHTKDMGIGNREDSLNDKIDSHNFLKNIGLGYYLEQRLVISLAEHMRQIAAFKQVNSMVEKELREKWQADINAWLKDSTKPNPYVLDKTDTPSEAQVRAALKRDEEAEVAAGPGGLPVRRHLSCGFHTNTGLKRHILAELRGLALIAPDRESKIQDLRLALLKKLAKFRTLQGVFMPGVAALIEREEATRDPDAAPPRAEKIKLWMPHELDDALPSCAESLPLNLQTR